MNCNTEIISSTIKKISAERKERVIRTVKSRQAQQQSRQPQQKKRSVTGNEEETKLKEMILSFRHYSWDLMIEYLRHIQSLSRRQEYVIRFPKKYNNEKEEDDVMTTGKLLEFITKNEEVDISDTESVDRYTWLFGRKVTTNDIDYIYDEPLVSGYNPIPFQTEITDKFSDGLLESYEVYRSGIFETEYYEPDVIGNVLYTMVTELSDTELLYTAEECYIIKNGAIQDNDPYAAGLLIDWEMPWISEPVKIGYLNSYSPQKNGTFEDFLNGVFSIYNQIKTTENTTGTLPIPNLRTLVEGHCGTNYINSWIPSPPLGYNSSQ